MLLERPRLRAALAARNVAAYVDEMLRFEPPVQILVRYAPEDAEIEGVPCPAGQAVLVMIGAANRDPARFTDPDAFDPARPDPGSLSFGFGPHYCLGAALSRLEGEVAFPALFERFPELAVAEPPKPANQLMFRGTSPSWSRSAGDAVYIAEPPRLRQPGEATQPLYISAAHRESFHQASQPSSDLAEYTADLAALYGFPVREEVLTRTHPSYALMGEAMRAALDSETDPVDLVLLTYAVPEVDPARCTVTRLNLDSAGDPFGFCVSDQGTAAPVHRPDTDRGVPAVGRPQPGPAARG